MTSHDPFSNRGGIVQQDWDTLMHNDVLKREDIYRQRVFGNNSGAKQFIELEERRKVKPQWLLLYLIFVVATYKYSFERLHISKEYDVYEAIRKPFETTVFSSSPQARRWKDIDSMDDVREWLLAAFPDIMTPDVQHFNIPLGQIRFTMRRMRMENNTDGRFNDYYASLWKNPTGIDSEATTSEDDDPTSFGTYRVWANVSLDWSYQSKADKKCPSQSTWIDTVDFPDTMGLVRIEKNCRQWCEQLIRPLTCHCFEQSAASGTCDFYQVPESGFTLAKDSDLYTEKRDTDASVILPKLEHAPKKGLSAMFPVMKKFTFQNNKQGYRKSPGFVQFLSYYSQAQLMKLAAEKQITPSSPQRVMSGEIEDWIGGGYIGKHTVTVAVDFATYNPNYDMFSWVQLTFQSTAAGYVEKKMKINSIRIIKTEELTNKWSLGQEFNGLWEIVYLGLVCFYCGCEIWEMTCCAKGLKYFTSGWNWLTLLHLLLNVVTICFWLAYKGQTDFINELIAMQSAENPEFSTSNLISFSSQVTKYRMFRISASFNMLFLAMQLLQYLNDIYPRVAVLVETVTDSFVPIFFFTLVCCIIIFGTIMWTYIWFGRRVSSFSSLKQTVVTVVSMTVGEFSSFNEVKSEFGIVSFWFYIPYQLFMIIVILNFPRAVLNAGYADASIKHMEDRTHAQKRLAAKESQGSDGAFRILKSIKMKMKAMFPEELNTKNLVERMQRRESMNIGHKKSNFFLYIIYCLLYTTMCVMIMRTSNASYLTKMVERSIQSSTFSKFNPITGDAIRGSNFESISTRADVNGFLEEVLPMALYQTSKGTFDGVENKLLNYSSAPKFRQLVMSNWNIMVGQKPVRITVKLNKMKALGSDAIKGVISEDYTVRQAQEDGEQSKVEETSGLPDRYYVPEKNPSGIISNSSRDILAKHCNYSFGYGAEDYVTNNGFVCSLDVSETLTRPMLIEMASGLITPQTAALTVEFLLYNAWAETFVYVAIRFGFQPSGLIWKDIEVEPVSLELFSGLMGALLVAILLSVFFLNCFYLFQNLWELIKAMKKGWSDCPQNSKAAKFAAVIREYMYFYLLDGFNALDSVSCIATLVTLMMFNNYTSSALSTHYFFQEEPMWVKGKCSSLNFEWCSDTEVITQFFLSKNTFRYFARVCACNTIAIYLRMLRYLKTFKHMRVIFSTLISGLEDILWFVVVFIVSLVGYMFMGHIVFGPSAERFKTAWSSLRACFEIFLGIFDSEALAEASLVIMIVYVLTFWFIFKLIIANMFLAIIDMNYNLLDNKRIKEDADKKDQRLGLAKPASGISKIMASLKGLFSGAPEKGEDSPAAAPQEEKQAVALADGGEAGAEAPATPRAENGDTGGGGDAGAAGAATEEASPDASAPLAAESQAATEPLQVCSKDHVTNANWKQLPEEVRDWSLEKANVINTFLHELILNKQNLQDDQNEASALEDALQKAETQIGEWKKSWGSDARHEKRDLDAGELAELLKVHQDQESLSWYIMKRDAELKKLESAKELKQDRFDKMVKAANSLIKPDEDGAQGGDGQLSLR